MDNTTAGVGAALLGRIPAPAAAQHTGHAQHAPQDIAATAAAAPHTHPDIAPAAAAAPLKEPPTAATIPPSPFMSPSPSSSPRESHPSLTSHGELQKAAGLPPQHHHAHEDEGPRHPLPHDHPVLPHRRSSQSTAAVALRLDTQAHGARYLYPDTEPSTASSITSPTSANSALSTLSSISSVSTAVSDSDFSLSSNISAPGLAATGIGAALPSHKTLSPDASSPYPPAGPSPVSRSKKPVALSLTKMESNHHRASSSSSAVTASQSQRLTDALNDLVLSGTASTPQTAMIKSPCFYHNRFDDAVNIDKVLDEIKNDDAMSHCRLVQTATSVREVSKQLQRRPLKRAVRSVMIVTKARDNQLVVLTNELTRWLLSTPRYGSDLGITVYVDSKLRNSKRFDKSGILAQNPRFEHMLKFWTPDMCWHQPEKFDLVLTLGGDGTVLYTSWLFQRIVPPVLSFSLGSLGFMTTFEFEKYRAHLDRVLGDAGMKINLRMRFTCTVSRAGFLPGDSQTSEQFEVLNELVIDRGPSPYVSNLELYGDDELLTVVQADGCIFSTPTGSTAYSLSAGGSLVHPDIPAILLTPICPHTLSFRPMVLSDTMALRVAVPRDSRATAYCAFDGKGRIELRQGDHVTITASQYPFPTVTRTDNEWFDSVRRTLRWNVRAAAQKPFDSAASTPDDEQGEDVWDIDTDSGFYASEDGSTAASPIRKQMLAL